MASKDQHFFYLFPADWPKASRLVAFLFGALTTLVFAPAEWSWLAPIVTLPLLFLALTLSPRDAAGHFFCYGFGLFLTGTYWIYISVHVFGNAALWIAVLLMVGLSLIMACFLWLAGWLISRLSQGEPWLLLLVGPAAWVAIEWLRGWVLTGFPWLAHGYGQVDSLLAGWAPVLGVYGVSLMLLISTAAILATILTHGRERLIALGIVILPWLLGGILKTVDWTEPYGEAVQASVLQAGIAQDQKWLAEKREETLAFYRDATLRMAKGDLVIWPEVAVPAVTDQVGPYLDTIESIARNRQQTVLFGILERNFERADGRIFNSILALGADSRQVYRKRHLVPFGEYFPVPASVREWMRMQSLPYSDMSAGDATQPLIVSANGAKIASVICYEDAYGAEQLYAFPDADLILNISNDAWFGDSIAPHQHLQIARMRSLEVGRYSIRATNTGISAFIGADGKILQSGKQFVPEIMTRKVRLHRGATPYVSGGNWPVIGFCFAILGLLWVRSKGGF